MTNPGGHPFGDETPEADKVEQEISVNDGDEDTWKDASRLTSARDWEANEADLIEQAIAVPDDESEFDR